mmetsp:Transcript_22238/g.46634  ORF Transcript_22238/g.46634 Transcript_22238/m.46634 type:complete len:217 (+) Transcript_22238:855-1505(+)
MLSMSVRPSLACLLLWSSRRDRVLLSVPLVELLLLSPFVTFWSGCLDQSYCPVAEDPFWLFFPPTLQRPVKADARLSNACKGFLPRPPLPIANLPSSLMLMEFSSATLPFLPAAARTKAAMFPPFYVCPQDPLNSTGEGLPSASVCLFSLVFDSSKHTLLTLACLCLSRRSPSSPRTNSLVRCASPQHALSPSSSLPLARTHTSTRHLSVFASALL